jgi:hypothetical protein
MISQHSTASRRTPFNHGGREGLPSPLENEQFLKTIFHNCSVEIFLEHGACHFFEKLAK